MQVDKNALLIKIISLLVVAYLTINLLSPVFFEEGKRPRKIETSDVVAIGLILLFNSGVLDRLQDLGISQEKGFSATFKIGNNDNVPLKDLGSTVTDRLRELEKNIEALKKQQMTPSIKAIEPKPDQQISDALESILVDNVYTMLNSNLWLGRYVDTIAYTTSVSEDIIIKFCQSRNDIELREHGGRRLAVLKDRSEALEKHLKSKERQNQQHIS